MICSICYVFYPFALHNVYIMVLRDVYKPKSAVLFHPFSFPLHRILYAISIHMHTNHPTTTRIHSKSSDASGMRCRFGLHRRRRCARYTTTPALMMSPRTWWADNPRASACVSNLCSCFLVILIFTTVEESPPLSPFRFSKVLVAFPSPRRSVFSSGESQSSSSTHVRTRLLLQFPILFFVVLLSSKKDCNE